MADFVVNPSTSASQALRNICSFRVLSSGSAGIYWPASTYSDADATWCGKFSKRFGDGDNRRLERRRGTATYQSLKLELASKLEPVSMAESKLEKVSDSIDVPQSKLEPESQEELPLSWVLLLLSVP